MTAVCFCRYHLMWIGAGSGSKMKTFGDGQGLDANIFCTDCHLPRLCFTAARCAEMPILRQQRQLTGYRQAAH